jgi:hypothetical protein
MRSSPRSKRRPTQFGWAGAIAAVAALALPLCAQTAQADKPVLVELFTSEGCSDCPPADRVLAALDKTQPYTGLHAIVLSEHVTYWNQLGWRDPFSMEEMTERQQAYVSQFRLSSAYTPQMVVDGTAQFVGSDVHALDAAMRAAAERPVSELDIKDARWENGAVEFSVHGAASEGVRLTAALAADAARVEVARGENAGRTLQHVAVVRAMKSFGREAMDGRVLKLSARDVPSGPVRLVVFAVEDKTGQVVGAAEQTLPR